MEILDNCLSKALFYSLPHPKLMGTPFGSLNGGLAPGTVNHGLATKAAVP